MAVVLSHRPTSGILLNAKTSSSPPAPEHLLLAAPSSNSLNSSSSSTSSSGSWSHTRTTRRIHFAPLPEPRTDDFELVQESDDTACTEDPVDDDDDTNTNTTSDNDAKPTPSPPPSSAITLTPSVSIDSSHSSNTIKSHPRAKPSKLLAFLKPSPSPPPHTTSPPTSPYPSTSRLPRISAEDILTLGTIHLFRSSSRNKDPPASTSSGWGKPLERWSSTGSGSAFRLGRAKPEWPGSPLSRTSSIESNATTDSTRGRTLLPGSSASSSLRSSPEDDRRTTTPTITSSRYKPGAGGGRHATLPASKARPQSAPSSPNARVFQLPTSAPKGVRMLNGRVYGAKRHGRHPNANPFANARDEPEFVEWGYGGMGSVQSGVGGMEMWRGLQRGERGGALLGGAAGAKGTASAGAKVGGKGEKEKEGVRVGEEVGAGVEPVDEDGSGMGWVKRRREQREREKREREEAEKAKAAVEAKEGVAGEEAKGKTSMESTKTVVEEVDAGTSKVVVEDAQAGVEVTTAVGDETKAADDEVKTEDTKTGAADDETKPGTPIPHEEHHILTAVRLSPTHGSRPHAHHRSASQASAHAHTHTHTHHRAPSQSSAHHPSAQTQGGLVIGLGDDEALCTSPIQESQSESEEQVLSESEDGEDIGDDESEESEESEGRGEEAERKTARGAGVEKISRHKDER